jgi:hypothetical protein
MVILLVPLSFAFAGAIWHAAKNRRFPLELLPILAGFLLMGIPLLAQTNWNSGQFVVLRYVVWLMVPVFVATTCSLPRNASWPCLATFSLFVALFGTIAFDLLVKHNQMSNVSMRPWVRIPVVLKFYDPLPEIFIERTLGRELLESTSEEFLPVAYRSGEGGFVKFLVKEGNLDGAVGATCRPELGPLKVLRDTVAPRISSKFPELSYYVVTGC